MASCFISWEQWGWFLFPNLAVGMKRKTAPFLLWIGLSVGLRGCDLVRAIMESLQPQQAPVVTPDVTDTPTPIPPNPDPAPSGRPAVISGLPEGSKMNVHSQPSTQAPVIYYGTVGDRVNVTQQQQDSNGNTWYYVTFDDGDAQGWVYGSLLRFLGNTPNNSTPNTNTPINSDTALRRCRSQAEAELPGTRIQVSQGWLNSDGSYVVNWSSDSRAYGTCTVDRNGWVVSFVNTDNNGPNSSIPQAALRGCENRVARELGLSLYDIEVREASAYADGTFGVDWWTTDGRSGFCRVARNGWVLAFVTNDRPFPRQVALKRCRDRARQAYPGTRIEVYIDPRERGRNYKVLWSADSGADGYCRVDQNGYLYEFVDYSNGGGGDGNVRCFGRIFGDTAFTAFSRDNQFRRVVFRNQGIGDRSVAYLTPAGENQQGQPIYQGQIANSPSDQITVIDRSSGNPNPGSEISLAYNGQWARGRCR